MTKYFVLFVAYDGKGHSAVSNEIVSLPQPIGSYADIEAVQTQLAELAKADHVILLHFIPLGQDAPPSRSPAKHNLLA
jgi:hypothetical protein